MSPITDLLKKDLSLKRKPSATSGASAPKPEETSKNESPESSQPKRAQKQRKASSGSRHKQLVGLSIGASELAAAVIVRLLRRASEPAAQARGRA